MENQHLVGRSMFSFSRILILSSHRKLKFNVDYISSDTPSSTTEDTAQSNMDSVASSKSCRHMFSFDTKLIIVVTGTLKLILQVEQKPLIYRIKGANEHLQL